MANNPLLEAVENLAEARANVATLKAEFEVIEQVFLKENEARLQAIKLGALAVEVAESAVRALADLSYKADPTNRKPAPGVEIKIVKTYEVDSAAGLAWAKEKQLCLIPEALDLAAVKKLATVQALPFVTVTETGKAFVAADLAKALASASTSAADAAA